MHSNNAQSQWLNGVTALANETLSGTVKSGFHTEFIFPL
jgi:hypothetical protein